MKILRRVIQNGLVAFRKYPTSNGLAVLSVGLCIGLGGALVRLLSGTILRGGASASRREVRCRRKTIARKPAAAHDLCSSWCVERLREYAAC
jgi:hypothetical protein